MAIDGPSKFSTTSRSRQAKSCIHSCLRCWSQNSASASGFCSAYIQIVILHLQARPRANTVGMAWGVQRSRHASHSLKAGYILDLRCESSSLAMDMRWTSSGPSAMRSVRAPAHRRAKGTSSETPAPPCAWMAASSTDSTVDGASTFAAAILPRACSAKSSLVCSARFENCSHQPSAEAA